MSWITVDTKLHKHPKMALLPSDAARWAWVCVLLESKEQRKPGTFASLSHFRLVMGAQARYLEAFKAAGLIDSGDDGTMTVHDWRKHQWAVAQGTRRGLGDDSVMTSGGQQEDVSRAVPVSVLVGVGVTEKNGEETRAREVDAAVSLQHRTGEIPGPKVLRWLDQLAKAHGERRLADKIDQTPYAGELPEYLKGIRAVLVKEELRAESDERRDEERRNAEKRKPVVVESAPDDISDEEAKRLAIEYTQRARQSA